MNTQFADAALRSGTKTDEDCKPFGSICALRCGTGFGRKDGYDDSIAILMSLEDARLLTEGLSATYIKSFTDQGAIDHIIVAGPGSDAFEDAASPDVSGKSFLGSDHRAIMTSR